MADDFVARKFQWIDQIAADGELPPHAARLAIVLLRYVNRKTGDAWPAIPTLAAAMGMVENSVRNALRAMVTNGHLAVDAGGGRGATNRYRWLIKSDNGAKNSAVKPCKSVQGIRPEKPLKDLQGLETKTLHHGALNPAKSCAKPCTVVNPNPYKNTIEEPTERETLSAPPEKMKKKDPAKKAQQEVLDALAGFEEFYRAYPRKVAKESARRAYAKALDVGVTAQELLSGAERFALEREREPDPAKREKFTPHAATWLSQGRWLDEPAQNHSQRADFATGRRPSMFDLAFSGRMPK
jgi:hypothetical protein